MKPPAKRFHAAILAIALAVSALPTISSAAVTATDSFDTYSVGTLQGANGGTGWTGTWHNYTDNALYGLVTNLNAYDGTQSALMGSGTFASSYRDYTSSTSQCFQFFVRAVNSNKTHRFQFSTGAGTTAYCVDFDTDAKIYVKNNSCSETGKQDLGSYSANTWYPIVAQYESSQNQMRFQYNYGTWSNWTAATSNGIPSRFSWMSSVASDPYLDAISPTTTCPSLSTATPPKRRSPGGGVAYGGGTMSF